MRGYKRIGPQRSSAQSQAPRPLLPRPQADSTAQQWSNCDTSPRQKTDWQYRALLLHTPGLLISVHMQYDLSNHFSSYAYMEYTPTHLFEIYVDSQRVLV